MDALFDSDDFVSELVLADNCIVRLTENGNPYCAICIERKSSRNWYRHITDATHVSTLKRFDLIFERRGTGFFCKACNVHLEWGIFDFHAVIHRITPWYQPQDFYRKFVEHHVTSWGSRYYCWLCDDTFSEFNAASTHLMDAKHRDQAKCHLPDKETVTLTDYGLPYELLVANGIVVSVSKSLQCKICECWSMGPKNVRKHIAGRAHKAAKLTFIRKLKTRVDRERPREAVDDQQREENRPAEEQENRPAEDDSSSDDEDLLLDDGPIVFMVAVPADNDPFERAQANPEEEAQANPPEEAQVNPPEVAQANPPQEAQADPLEEAQANPPEEAQANPPEDEIFLRNSLEYICVSAVYLGRGKYFCRICKMDFARKDKLWEHFSERLHAINKRRYGCDQVYFKGTQFYCNFCNITFANRNLASDHIETDAHFFLVHLHIVAIHPVNEHKYHCKVCDSDVFNTKNLRKHVLGPRHIAAERVYGCNMILRQDHLGYECKLCDTFLLNRKSAYDHISSEEHMSNLHNHCISIQTVDINKFRCVFCNVFSYGDKDIAHHLKGKRHVTAQEKHGCKYIVRKLDGKFYCVCCDVEFRNRQLAIDHIGENYHIYNARLPSIAILFAGVDKYLCTMCNVECSGQTNLDAHLKQSQHLVSEFKYGCANISIREGSEYYCKCCNVVLRTRQLAMKHMREERHVYNANLPCITISIIESSKYHCSICNLDIKERVNLERHIGAPRHSTAQKIYSCDKIWRRSDSYYCELCNASMRNQQLAFVHLREESHKNSANLPCLSLKMVDLNNIHCKICDVSTNNTKEAVNHVESQPHQEALKKFGGFNISPRDGNQFYCSCCDNFFLNRNLASDHLTSDTHVFNAHLPCISVARTNDNNYHCVVCCLDFSTKNKLKSHVKLKEHTISKRKSGCEYLVQREDCKDGSLFYCNCCYLALKSRHLASEHLRDDKHLFNANLPCISVATVDAGMYRCKICSTDIYGTKALEGHVTNMQHALAQREYGCDFITLDQDNLYHCDCCNASFTDRQLACDHITDRTHTFNANLPCASIMITDTDNYGCTICGVDKLKEAQIDDHLREDGHVTARKKHGCDDITRKVGNLYYCGCCDSALSSRQLVADHIKQASHMFNANWPCVSITIVDTNKYNCTVCNTDCGSKAILTEHLEGKRHRAARKKYGCDSLTRIQGYRYYCSYCDINLGSRHDASVHIKDEMHLFNANLPCISVIMPVVNEYRCTICEISCVGKKSIMQHVKGRRHALAQSKFGCTEIYLKDDYWYHCACCDSTLLNHQLVVDHLKEESHVISANLPCISIALINTNCYHCTICNIVSSNAADLRYHVQGRRHVAAQAKFGCSKVLRQPDNQYRCECCNVTLHNRMLACSHVKNEEHARALGKPKQKEPKPSVSLKRADPVFQDSATSTYCAVCDCQISGTKGEEVAALVGEHIKGDQHADAVKKFVDNGLTIEKRGFYFCKYCSCEICGFRNASNHFSGSRHEAKRQTMQTTAGDKEAKADEVAKPSEDAARGTVGQPVRDSRRRGNRSQQVIYEHGLMICTQCNVAAVDTANLHAHLTQHVTEKLADPNNRQNAEARNHGVDNANQAGLMGLELYDRMNDMAMEMRETIKDLEFDAKYMYTLEDKLADFQLGMKLSFEVDESIMHCFVCMKAIESSRKDYYLHLCTLDHHNYLDELENDHKFFANAPEKVSQLDLALQYMHDVSDSIVHCFACGQDVRNVNVSLRRHIDSEKHREEFALLEAKETARDEEVLVQPCDWYDVKTYWCVPCSIKCTTEFNFAQHLEGEAHKNEAARHENAKKKAIFDFCAPCALLWYGYRCTWNYHRDISTHSWLTRDRNPALELPKYAKMFLEDPEKCLTEITRYHDQVLLWELEKEAALLWDLEKMVKPLFPHSKAYTFGSRVCGLASPDTTLDIFLDCGNMYSGECASMYLYVDFMNEVHACLSNERQSWEVFEVVTFCRTPIIRARHVFTRLTCDIYFESGLPVETSFLIKSFYDAYPPCREITLYVKQWLRCCDIANPGMIPNYTLYWCVIFYLQTKSILPSIASLIAMENESRLIGGWETGVSREFTCNRPERDVSSIELLVGFFRFYAHFDYRHLVACPLLGEVIEKRAFAEPETLPEEMNLYKVHLQNRGYNFAIDCVLCIQDPFDLHHNIGKSVSKVYLNHFRKYCLASLSLLNAP